MRVFLLPILLTGALLLAACGSDDQGSDPGGADSQDSRVADGTYVSDSVTVAGAEHPLVPGSQIVLTVDGESVHLNAGCNGMSGGATWTSDSLTVGNLAMTQMGCEQPLTDQDTWLAEVFSGKLDVASDGDGFTVTKDDTVLAFVEQQPVADAPLQDTLWTLESIGSGGGDDSAVSSVPGKVTSTLTISEDRIHLSPGCNQMNGRVEVTDSTITANKLASTMMACADERGDVEREVALVFDSGPLDYVIEGAALTLTASDGSMLVYRASS
ncbi:MAG: META domain-containing protein [Nocardioides sp.]|uniref:META domain-containing protein n=1 Tax=Nocardioides sp. TaxID=35761 RepID=UPI0039E71F8D